MLSALPGLGDKKAATMRFVLVKGKRELTKHLCKLQLDYLWTPDLFIGLFNSVLLLNSVLNNQLSRNTTKPYTVQSRTTM